MSRIVIIIIKYIILVTGVHLECANVPSSLCAEIVPENALFNGGSDCWYLQLCWPYKSSNGHPLWLDSWSLYCFICGKTSIYM